MCDFNFQGSDCEDMMNSKNSPDRCGSSSSDGGSHLIKTCADCGTTKTPLWRGGPAGPKVSFNLISIFEKKTFLILFMKNHSLFCLIHIHH